MEQLITNAALIDMWLDRVGCSRLPMAYGPEDIPDGALALSPEQAGAIYDTTSEIVLVAGGQGGGKSFVSAMYAFTRQAYTPLLWLVGPSYDLVNTSEFEQLLLLCQLAGVVDEKSISAPLHGPRSFRLKYDNRPAMEVQTKSASDVAKLAARGPGGVVLAEAAQMPVDVFWQAMGRLARAEQRQRFRPWLLLSGTFEEAGPWFRDLFWKFEAYNDFNGKSYSIPTYANPKLYPLRDKDPKWAQLKKITPEDQFNEKYLGIPVKPQGLVLTAFDDKVHIRSCPFNPDIPVTLAIDPGYGGSHYAVWAIQKPEPHKVRCIDLIWELHKTTEEMIKLARAKPWWGNVNGGWEDVASRQHASNRSVKEQWHDAGIWLLDQKVHVFDNVERIQNCFGEPGWIEIDPRCEGFLYEVMRWKRKKAPDGMFLDPENDNCDAIKALGYWLYGEYGPVEWKQREPDHGPALYKPVLRRQGRYTRL